MVSAREYYKEAVYFAVVMAREYPQCTPTQINELLQLARRHGRLCVRLCNEGGAHLEKMREKCEEAILQLVQTIGCKVKLRGDPRGFTVKVLIQSKRYNTWGGEEEDSWGVPQ
jgi:hypothetical protein